MSRQEMAPRIRWLPRFIRGRQFDRNPLRRTSDRVETVALIVALVAFSIGAPLTAAEQTATLVRKARAAS